MFQKNSKILSIIPIVFLISACSSGKWSNEEKNYATQECLGETNIKSNYGKLHKKYCECSIDFLSKKAKINELSSNDEYVAIGKCKHHIEGKKAENALMKDMGI